MNRLIPVVAMLLAASCTSDDSSGPGTSQGTAGSTATGYVSEADDNGSTYEGVTCDDSTQGIAWCDDDFNVVYCSSGTWYSFDCAYLGQFCAADGDDVDCFDF